MNPTAYKLITEAARDIFFGDFNRLDCYAFCLLMDAADHVTGEKIDDPDRWAAALWRSL